MLEAKAAWANVSASECTPFFSMNTFHHFTFAFAITLAFSACNRPAPEPPVVEQPLVVQATPAPTPEPTPATPTPEPNYFAPEGVFYLVTSASIETSDSVTGLYPGTRVVKQPDGRYLADGYKIAIELRSNQVTNDLRVANRIISAQAADAERRRGGQGLAPLGLPPPATQPDPQTIIRQPAATPQPRQNPLEAPARRVNPDPPRRYRPPGTAF